MIRCASAGRYRVRLRVSRRTVPPGEPYRVQIHGHHDVVVEVDGRPVLAEAAPWVGATEPYTGELCAHELAFLGGVPGRDYSIDYEFVVKKIGD